MKTPRLLKLAYVIFIFFLLAPHTLQAQKNSLKFLKSVRAQQLSSAGVSASKTAASMSRQAAAAAQTAAAAARPSFDRRLRNEAVSLSHADAKQLETLIRERQTTAKPLYKKSWMQESPREKVEEILDKNKHPVAALRALWRLEDQYQNKHFFSFLATAYYKRNFSTHTPHLREFFKKVESLHSRSLEEKVIKRMYFIIQNKAYFHAYFAPNIPKSGLRIRYTKDIGKLTPDSFRPENLILSFERKLNPGLANASIRHVTRRSVFNVGEKAHYPVYMYNGPLEFIPNLYLYLINGSHPKNAITISFDENTRSMAIYNEDRSLWLRITPHEYSTPENLHLHLNETRTATLPDANGEPIRETVNFNLFIPLSTPIALPKYKQADYLYEMMILRPIRYFQGNSHVKIIKKDIF